MDERIDLTQNRDFRKHNNLNLRDRVFSRNWRIMHSVNSDTWHVIGRIYDDKFTQSLEINNNYKKIYIENNHVVVSNYYEDNQYRCERCGRKIISSNYTLCNRCDDILNQENLTQNIFKKRELTSVF